MNYKKGILSVVLWFIYAMIAGTGMVGTAMTVLLPEGGSRPIGLVIAGVWLAVTGLVVFLLHRLFENKQGQQKEDSQKVMLIVEGVLFVALIAIGIVLRVREAMLYDVSAAGENIWFDTVKVTENTQIPQVVHGAVYFYLQVLHGLLIFFGNKMSAALILQVILQMFTGIFLYFAVRKLTGAVAAIVSFGYWMLSPIFSTTVVLGPEPLYLLLWMIGLCAVAGALERFQQKGNIPGICSLIGFFLGGIVTGVLGYLDIMGFLLLLIAFSVLFLETIQQTGFLRRVGAVLLGILGTLAGFILCIALDAVSSGKLMENVLLAWWKVFAPEKFSWAVTYARSDIQGRSLSAVVMVVMVTILGLGAFAYWCRRQWERQSVWVAVTIALGVMICCGMTTLEMQGFLLLSLLVGVAAGAGVQAILPYEPAGEQPEISNITEESVEVQPRKRRLKVQDLENEDFPEEPGPVLEDRNEPVKIQFIENPLPLPKKHVPKVLDYKLNNDDGDFDYPVAEDDDFDH